MDGAGAAQRLRWAGAGLVALALAAAALAIVSGPQASLVLMPAAQTCPPPCVPHVFSAAEESMLAGGQNKGKLMLPGGDSAVMEAMKAANDANGQMNALAPEAASPGPSEQLANPFQPSRTASAVIGHGGRPFVSQWDQMHGDSEGDWQRRAPARPAAGRAASDAVAGSLQANLRASSGTLRAGEQESSGESRRDSAQDSPGAEVMDGDSGLSGETLSDALRQLSNRRLRAIVRVLLKSRASSDGGFDGRRGGVSELRAILDGSRKRQEQKRQEEQEELRHVRKAMDELAYQASRRRAEDDAIAALSRRLGGGDDRSDSSRRGSLADGQRRGSLLVDSPRARMDDLWEEDDAQTGARANSPADQLIQLLRGGDERVADRGARRDRGQVRAELRGARGGARGGAEGADQNKKIVAELAELAARSPRGGK
jgi:hypothetical protein